MLRGYGEFIRGRYRHIAIFVLLMVLSVPGQTFFISLFTEGFLSKYGVSSAELGGIFAIATFCSAFSLARIGKVVDDGNIPFIVTKTGIGLAIACAGFSLPLTSPWLLLILVFCLRFSGQGLFYHIANSAIVKALPHQAGKMLAVIGTLFSLVSIAIPIVLVAIIAGIGWERAFLVVSVFVVVGASLASYSLRGLKVGTGKEYHASPKAKTLDSLPSLRAVFALAPVMILFSFIFTGLLFHQAVLAQEKGWSLSWLAGCFSVFALSKALSSLYFGDVMDRIGSRRVFPYFLLPMALGLAAVYALDTQYGAILYLGLFGISGAIDLKLGTILWRDIYSADSIGYIRSKFEGIRIAATGLSPFVVGWLLDRGVTMLDLIGAFFVIAVVAIACSHTVCSRYLEIEKTNG